MEKILIVDDQARIRETFGRVLSKDGYSVFKASDADHANEILKREKIDLMLLDMKMPEVGGEILCEIKRTFHKETKVIVCSVYPLDDQKQMIEGADDYFDKSEGLRVLREKVSHVLNRSDQKKRLLIIDDEQKVRILYSIILNKAGYLVKSFGDNQTALSYLKHTGTMIDLLILDLAMPQIDGCCFFEIMKIRHPNTKILIASNYGLDTQKFMIFDADDYFDKTQGNALLLGKVKKLIG